MEIINWFTELPPEYIWIAMAVSFMSLFIMGISNQVVVFNDFEDFLITLSPLGFLLAALILGSYFGEETTGGKAAVIIGLVASVMAVGYIFVSSIKHNGLILGLLVGFFKFVSSLLILVLAFSLIGKIISPDPGNPFATASSNWAARLTYIVLFALLMWITRKMINGDSVRQSQMSKV